jgi:hypothetical protein
MARTLKLRLRLRILMFVLAEDYVITERCAVAPDAGSFLRFNRRWPALNSTQLILLISA